jgi:SAM-dependent methyltransferase
VTEPSSFYTGLVAQMYSTLRTHDPDPAPYARFIQSAGEPALELGCGDGDPLLDLLTAGFDVEGLDSSPDMLDRCRTRAAERGLEVVLHHSTIEEMAIDRRYRSIFLAGATFNLIPDDVSATRALRRVAQHLDRDGLALIPLFIPPEPDAGGAARELTGPDGAQLRCTTVEVRRDEELRTQRSLLRYERRSGSDVETVEREWLLHWHTQDGFARLVAESGLETRAVLRADGKASQPDDQEFTFLVGSAR